MKPVLSTLNIKLENILSIVCNDLFITHNRTIWEFLQNILISYL